MDLSIGRIIFASRNSYTVLTKENKEYFSVITGTFMRESDTMPAVGDYVVFSPNNDGDSKIVEILPRDTVLSRKKTGKEFKEHVLAANADYLFIINAMDSTFSKRRIERFLVLAGAGGVQPVIILSKADACSPVDMAVYHIEAEEVAGGAEVIEVSSVTGMGIPRLEELLQENKTAVVAGLSGAGKSTLVNRLAGYDVRKTAQVRAFDDKGRHCTTDRHMFRTLSGAMIIDTPGIREVGMSGDVEAVEDVFTEISDFAEGCFFADCTHTHEPSCAVRKAVEEGGIKPERYESYLKLRAESENYRMRTEAPEEVKRAGKRLSKLVRSVNKQKKRF
jgi:ribosome biogenesis GTPase